MQFLLEAGVAFLSYADGQVFSIFMKEAEIFSSGAKNSANEF